MRLDAILREATRNVLSGTSRTIILTVLLTTIVVGLIFAELTTTRAITAEAERYRAAGASIVTLVAADQIDGVACEALSQLSDVRASGALRSREEGITAAALPSSSIPVMEISGGFTALLSADVVPDPGIILSDQAVEVLGVRAGDTLVTRSGNVVVAGTYEYPEDGRRSGLGYAALVQVPTQNRFDECWVDVWPTSPEVPTLMRTVLFPSEDESTKPVLSQLNTTLGTGFDGNERFNERITRYAAPLGFFVAALLGYVAVRGRRIQFASALHAGARKADLTAILGIEFLSWTVSAAAFASSLITVWVVAGAGEDRLAFAALGLSIAVPAFLGPYIGGLIALSLIKERHLFRYFKDR